MGSNVLSLISFVGGGATALLGRVVFLYTIVLLYITLSYYVVLDMIFDICIYLICHLLYIIYHIFNIIYHILNTTSIVYHISYIIYQISYHIGAGKKKIICYRTKICHVPHQNLLGSHRVSTSPLKTQRVSTPAHPFWYKSKVHFSFDLMVQIKQKRGYGVENPHLGRFSGGIYQQDMQSP